MNVMQMLEIEMAKKRMMKRKKRMYLRQKIVFGMVLNAKMNKEDVEHDDKMIEKKDVTMMVMVVWIWTWLVVVVADVIVVVVVYVQSPCHSQVVKYMV